MWAMTLTSNFRCPLVREYCLKHGLRSCARSSCKKMLRRPGNAIMLFPGGAAEALVTQQGLYNLVSPASGVGRQVRGLCLLVLLALSDYGHHDKVLKLRRKRIW
jgi:hypothetical protein